MSLIKGLSEVADGKREVTKTKSEGVAKKIDALFKDASAKDKAASSKLKKVTDSLDWAKIKDKFQKEMSSLSVEDQTKVLGWFKGNLIVKEKVS